MPLFKVEVFKSYLGEQWGNVYMVRASDLAEAATAAPIIVAAEREFTLNLISFVQARTSDMDPGTDAFVSSPLSGVGSRTPGNNPLTLWNTLRVDFEVDGGGRPARKYYRGVLDETTVNYLDVDTSLRSDTDASLTGMISDLATNSTPYVDPDDQDVINAVVYGKVQMRQLHRKRRRAAPSA